MRSVASVLVFLLAVAHGLNHIPTPFGMMPETCVHRVRSGSTIREVEGGVHIAHEEGNTTLPTRPECLAWLKERLLKTQARFQNGQNITAPADGWLDYAGYYPPKLVSRFSSRYRVPNTPQAAGGLLYYFIGTENFQSGVGVTILQPVLTYYRNGWTFASWNCCPSGQAHESSPISGFGPGAVVDGLIDQSGPNWQIFSGWGSRSTVLTVADANRDFNWVDVTLETYYVTQCSQFASGPADFSSMRLTLEGNTVVAPRWTADSHNTECNGRLSIASPYDITIQHN